jgi:hypothetical protein
MTNEQLDPATLAAYDQALAASMEYVDGLIQAYVSSCADVEGDPGDAANVVMCAAALSAEVPRQAMAGALAVAVMRLARAGA